MEKATKVIWIKIFKFLDSKDLEKATKVSKEWNDIITKTPSIRRKLDLEVDFSDPLNMQKCLKYPYCNLNMKSISFTHWTQVNQMDFTHNAERVFKFIESIDCKKVEKIYIGVNSQFPICKGILEKFQNLTTLSTESLFYTIYGHVGKTINMRNLKYLKTSSFILPFELPLANLKVLHLMNHKNLVSVAPTEDRLYVNEASNFGDFIQSCSNLKHLILTRFYTKKLSSFRGRLETFEIVGVHSLPSDFKNFLKTQKSTLKTLSLDVLKFDDEISNIIYFEMNLETILDSRVRHGKIIKLKANNSLKNLTIRIKSQEKEELLFFKNLFTCCPMLEVLDINLPKSKEVMMLLMIAKLPKLKHLKLSHVEENESINLPIGKLEGIRKLTFYGGIFGFNSMTIVSLCPNVKTVEIIDRDKIIKPGSKVQPKLDIFCEQTFIEITKNFNYQIGFVKLKEKSSNAFSVTEKNLWMLDEEKKDFEDSNEYDNHVDDIESPYNFRSFGIDADSNSFNIILGASDAKTFMKLKDTK